MATRRAVRGLQDRERRIYESDLQIARERDQRPSFATDRSLALLLISVRRIDSDLNHAGLKRKLPARDALTKPCERKGS